MTPPHPTKLVVVGSLNVDEVALVDHLPAPGETLTAAGFASHFGGKGANQAVAAARLGASVEMIGCLGEDDLAEAYRERLTGLGVGTRGLASAAGTRTGRALISVDRRGENTIVVAPGANTALSPHHVHSHRDLIAAADGVLIQNEIPAEAISAAVALAAESGATVYLNPAPWRPGPLPQLRPSDVVVANQTEARAMLGHPPTSPADLSAFPSNLVVTRGPLATLVHSGNEQFAATPPAVEAVDTVGAGDTFCGALAAFHGRGLRTAVELANRAAALATTAVGAQQAMPGLDAVAPPGSGG